METEINLIKMEVAVLKTDDALLTKIKDRWNERDRFCTEWTNDLVAQTLLAEKINEIYIYVE